MLHITRTIAINEKEITFSFIRSSGPGGQNVNKVSTAVQIRFDVNKASSLPDARLKFPYLHLTTGRFTDDLV